MHAPQCEAQRGVAADPKIASLSPRVQDAPPERVQRSRCVESSTNVAPSEIVTVCGCAYLCRLMAERTIPTTQCRGGSSGEDLGARDEAGDCVQHHPENGDGTNLAVVMGPTLLSSTSQQDVCASGTPTTTVSLLHHRSSSLSVPHWATRFSTELEQHQTTL
mmetsp:Transcript_44319/g.104113  ORF Transcript_44319/g.104113 Transcript_44319/m.104113 type:complete len:162 (-) Transcript_44319:106-591(-)